MSLDFISEGSGGNITADSINLQGAFEGATMSLQSLIPGATLAPIDHSQDVAGPVQGPINPRDSKTWLLDTSEGGTMGRMLPFGSGGGSYSSSFVTVGPGFRPIGT